MIRFLQSIESSDDVKLLKLIRHSARDLSEYYANFREELASVKQTHSGDLKKFKEIDAEIKQLKNAFNSCIAFLAMKREEVKNRLVESSNEETDDELNVSNEWTVEWNQEILPVSTLTESPNAKQPNGIRSVIAQKDVHFEYPFELLFGSEESSNSVSKTTKPKVAFAPETKVPEKQAFPNTTIPSKEFKTISPKTIGLSNARKTNHLTSCKEHELTAHRISNSKSRKALDPTTFIQSIKPTKSCMLTSSTSHITESPISHTKHVNSRDKTRIKEDKVLTSNTGSANGLNIFPQQTVSTVARIKDLKTHPPENRMKDDGPGRPILRRGV